MNYQQAQEGIAEIIVSPSNYEPHNGFNVDLTEIAEEILALLFTPEEIEEWKKGGYPAIVCKDQKPPYYDSKWVTEAVQKYLLAQQDMTNAGFRRVKGVK